MSGRPYVVGVTGGIATGKSAVLAILADLGAEVIDADLVYRGLVEAGQPLLARLVNQFGPTILDAKGRLDRQVLGSIVFADAAKLAELDALTHPAVRTEIDRRVATTTADVVAIEAVKLIESGHAAACDEVWLVVARSDIQRKRLLDRSGLSSHEVDRRLAAQPDEMARRAVADHVVDNSGTLDELRNAVDVLWKALLERRLSG